MKTDLILKVQGLKKYYPIFKGILRKEIGIIKAVDGIDFTIPRGTVVGMVGESGSGKSTAARASIRLIEPTAGEIDFNGQSLLALNPKELRATRRFIQMVFQDPYASLNPRKTVAENVGEALIYHQLVTHFDEMEDKVADTLKQVGLLPDMMRRYPHEFSGGQQQRICIARALILNPTLIICDEVVSALDVSIQAQILNLLMDLKEIHQLSYLFISHDLSVIRHLADDVIVLYAGKIVENAPTEELFNDPKHPYTLKLLAAVSH
jgi:peptide/nickel transport system ATP-binding protein/oligopeptide transport system ATP-binding protein